MCKFPKVKDLCYCYPIPGQGTLTLEGSMGMCRPQDPAFQALFQLQRPYFYFLKKIFALLSPIFADFWLNFSSRDKNFSGNSFPRSQFQAKESVPETLLLKTWAAHIYRKFFSSNSPMTPSFAVILQKKVWSYPHPQGYGKPSKSLGMWGVVTILPLKLHLKSPFL